MRTTLEIDTPLLEKLRRLAERRGVTMGQLATELLGRGLRDASSAPAAAKDQSPSGWRAYDMGPPLIPLEDKDRVYRILDAGAGAVAEAVRPYGRRPRAAKPR